MRYSFILLTASLLSTAACAQTLDNVPSPTIPVQSQTAPQQAPAPVVNAAPAQPATQCVPAPAPVVPVTSGLKLSHGVVYLSGGVNTDEMNMLKAQESEFNVQILLANKKGEQLKGVPVKVTDYKGFVLVDAANAGPYFYAYIRPGIYNVLTPESKTQIKVAPKGVFKKTITLGK